MHKTAAGLSGDSSAPNHVCSRVFVPVGLRDLTDCRDLRKPGTNPSLYSHRAVTENTNQETADPPAGRVPRLAAYRSKLGRPELTDQAVDVRMAAPKYQFAGCSQWLRQAFNLPQPFRPDTATPASGAQAPTGSSSGVPTHGCSSGLDQGSGMGGSRPAHPSCALARTG